MFIKQTWKFKKKVFKISAKQRKCVRWGEGEIWKAAQIVAAINATSDYTFSAKGQCCERQRPGFGVAPSCTAASSGLVCSRAASVCVVCDMLWATWGPELSPWLWGGRVQFKVLNYTCRVSPRPRETHKNLLRTIHLNVSQLPCSLALPSACTPEWMRREGWLIPQPCPCGSKLGLSPESRQLSPCSWGAGKQSTDLSPFCKGRGAQHKLVLFLPHTAWDETLVSQ